MLGCFCQWAKVEIKASDIVSLPGKFQLLSYSWTWNTDQILREISPNKYILWATQYNLSNLADKLYCVAAVHGPGIIQKIYNSSETNNGQSLHGSLPQNATARVLHKSSIWIIYSLHCVCVLLLIGYNIHSPAPTTCSHVCVCVWLTQCTHHVGKKIMNDYVIKYTALVNHVIFAVRMKSFSLYNKQNPWVNGNFSVPTIRWWNLSINLSTNCRFHIAEQQNPYQHTTFSRWFCAACVLALCDPTSRQRHSNSSTFPVCHSNFLANFRTICIQRSLRPTKRHQLRNQPLETFLSICVVCEVANVSRAISVCAPRALSSSLGTTKTHYTHYTFRNRKRTQSVCSCGGGQLIAFNENSLA